MSDEQFTAVPDDADDPFQPASCPRCARMEAVVTAAREVYDAGISFYDNGSGTRCSYTRMNEDDCDTFLCHLHDALRALDAEGKP